MRTDLASRRLSGAGLLVTAALLSCPAAIPAQYVLTSPAGDSLVFESAELRVMLDKLRNVDNADKSQLDRLDDAVLSYELQMREEFS